MNNQQVMKILKPQFWKIGKSNGEQLWMHHYTVWYVFKKMLEVGALPQLDEQTEVFEVACLLHDWKKHTPWNQLVLLGETDTDRIINSYINWWQSKGVIIDNKEKAKINRLFERGSTDHQIETERDLKFILKPYLNFVKNELPFELTEDKIKMLFEIMKHHFLKEEDISEAELPGFGNYIYILKLCDRLASMERIDANTINQLRNINKLGRQIFDVTYFTISRGFAPSTALVSDVLFENYKKCGWLPLLYFEDGGVLVTRRKGKIPDKKAILNNVFCSFLSKSVEILPVQYGRKAMLTGVACDHPKDFIIAHQDEIKRRFNQDDAGVVFFKFLVELLDNNGYNTKDIREKYPVLDVLFGLVTGTRGIALANEKWRKHRDESLPMKDDKSGIDKAKSVVHIFDSVKITEVIPQSLSKGMPKDMWLRDTSSQELFDILLNLATQFDKETDRDQEIKKYLDDIISMEEEKDFRAIAQERFEQYKAYKLKPTDERTGVCEICGSTVTQKPGADFAKGQIQAFTQIKARADVPRKICPFCAYDNSIMRQGVGNRIPIYIKINSRIPLEFRHKISEEIIKPLKDGIIRIQNIEDMQERWGILFPANVPILVGESEYDVIDYVWTTERTEIISRIELVNPKEFSPKDQKAKYEPLYHLLNLLGFQVSIGAEEQKGLFGDEVLTTQERYLKSLAIVLLSSTIERKRSYLFAQDLLEKSPSIAISYLSQEYMDKRGQKRLSLKENLAERFVEFVYSSGIVLFPMNGGEYKMKNLLQDAAFFAEGIPKFCWSGEDWKKWHKDSSKHLISKPISQTLNEILQGRQFEEAFARFLSCIRENIAKEKSDEAKSDVKELEEFVRTAKERFKQFYDLKQKNISEFIRVKNALLSAVYVFKRYENLKEVCK
jgi:hypothetical protein